MSDAILEALNLLVSAGMTRGCASIDGREWSPPRKYLAHCGEGRYNSIRFRKYVQSHASLSLLRHEYGDTHGTFEKGTPV